MLARNLHAGTRLKHEGRWVPISELRYESHNGRVVAKIRTKNGFLDLPFPAKQVVEARR